MLKVKIISIILQDSDESYINSLLNIKDVHEIHISFFPFRLFF